MEKTQQKKLVQKILVSCVAFVFGITALIAIIMNIDKSKASGGIENPSANLPIISAGSDHTLAIVDGLLFAWGNGGNGQLGLSDQTSRKVPIRVGTETNWVSISAGYLYSLAINSLGELYAWGNNGNGQLGLGDTVRRLAPTRVGTASNWVSISAGKSNFATFSLAINSLGELYAWGSNGYGQLGLGDAGTGTNRNEPTRVGTATNWVSISAGDMHSLAINALGGLYAWGENSNGQLGLGDFNTRRNIPTRVGTEANWVNVSAGYNHSLAINSLGRLYAWGGNVYGQLGLGDNTRRNIPTRVGTEANWVNVSAGYYHSLAINSLGRLYAWGDNVYGQLGLGDIIDRSVPTRVGTETNWVSISAGGDNTATTIISYSFAINSIGELYACGYNGNGQLGLGDSGIATNRNEPTEVIFGNFVAVPNSGMSYTVSAPSTTYVYHGDSYTFTITRTSGAGHIGLGLSTTLGTLTYTTSGNVFTYTVSNVKGTITAADFTVTTYNVATPSIGTGYTISAPSTTSVIIGGSYTFTITLSTGYTLPIVKIRNTNGKVNVSTIDNTLYTYTISNVVGTILATDFTVTVSRIN